jgi:hypothetical protein
MVFLRHDDAVEGHLSPYLIQYCSHHDSLTPKIPQNPKWVEDT